MVKTLSKSGDNKNFTVRLDPDDGDAIRARASKLRMSQSYYISYIFKLELKYDLVNQFPDPVAVAETEDSPEGEKSEATALDPDEAATMIERLRSGGFIAGANVEAPTGSPGIPPPPSGPQRPVMHTPADLIRMASTGTGPEVQAALAGGVGGLQSEIRRRQLQEAQEEKRERAMRDKILESGAQESDDGS